MAMISIGLLYINGSQGCMTVKTIIDNEKCNRHLITITDNKHRKLVDLIQKGQ